MCVIWGCRSSLRDGTFLFLNGLSVCLPEPGACPWCCLCYVSDGTPRFRASVRSLRGFGDASSMPEWWPCVLSFAAGFPALPPSTASGWSCSRSFVNLIATRTIHKAKICWAPILPACQGWGLQSDMAPFRVTAQLCYLFSTWLCVCYCLLLVP